MSERKRILIVDDEPEIVQMLQIALQKCGYQGDGAGSGKAALKAVHDHIYGAAIRDFALHDMNGLEVHRELRQIDEELATNTLFCSGHAQTDQNLGYYSSFGVGFLSKPFDLQEIIDKLETLWVSEAKS